MTGAEPAQAPAVEQADAPRAAVAAQTVGALPQAACTDGPAAGLAANMAATAECTAAQAVMAEAPVHR